MYVSVEDAFSRCVLSLGSNADRLEGWRYAQVAGGKRVKLQWTVGACN